MANASRDVIERFGELRWAARRHANARDNYDYELELHDAAVAYVAAIRRAARREQGGAK
jgi:hypothetical protein